MKAALSSSRMDRCLRDGDPCKVIVVICSSSGSVMPYLGAHSQPSTNTNNDSPTAHQSTKPAQPTRSPTRAGIPCSTRKAADCRERARSYRQKHNSNGNDGADRSSHVGSRSVTQERKRQQKRRTHMRPFIAATAAVRRRPQWRSLSVDSSIGSCVTPTNHGTSECRFLARPMHPLCTPTRRPQKSRHKR